MSCTPSSMSTRANPWRRPCRISSGSIFRYFMRIMSALMITRSQKVARWGTTSRRLFDGRLKTICGLINIFSLLLFYCLNLCFYD